MFYKILNWFTGTKAWSWTTKKILARINTRLFGDPKFNMENWYEVEKICIENSDKILVFVSYGTKLTSLLIKLVSRCSWTHAGVIRVVDGKIRITHMESAGLLDQVLLELLKMVDNFAILEIPMTDAEKHRADFIRESYEKSKPGYDFQMLLKNNALYCSELIYEMCRFLPSVKPHVEAGRKVFEPDDVYRIGKVLIEYK